MGAARPKVPGEVSSCRRAIWLGGHARRLSSPPLASLKCRLLNRGGTRTELTRGTAGEADGRLGGGSEVGLDFQREIRRDGERQKLHGEQRHTEAEPELQLWCRETEQGQLGRGQLKAWPWSWSLRTSSGGPNRQEKAETIERVPETVAWGPRVELASQAPALNQPRLHSAFPGLSPGRKSLGTGETCVHTRNRPLAGEMARGLGERKDRQRADRTDRS